MHYKQNDMNYYSIEINALTLIFVKFEDDISKLHKNVLKVAQIQTNNKQAEVFFIFRILSHLTVLP